jgi:hypothetical protein
VSVLLGLLTWQERRALDAVARACREGYRSWGDLEVSRSALRSLARLGLIDMRGGGGKRFVRLSRAGAIALFKTDRRS